MRVSVCERERERERERISHMQSMERVDDTQLKREHVEEIDKIIDQIMHVKFRREHCF